MANQILQPKDFLPETTTVWDFPKRGVWATHKPDYRGNFAPQVPRNLIINYSQEGDIVFDPMMGSGTTLIESKLLNRNAIGYDINKAAVDITIEMLDFPVDNNSTQTVKIGDVRDLAEIKEDSIDLIITHPPYLNLVKYSGGENPEDLSSISNIPQYLNELSKGISEIFRVLKHGKYCAILMGDTRKGQHYIPLSHMILNLCLKCGFVIKEEIIKTQHNTMYARRWRSSANKYRFYLIMHEHLYIFRKPLSNENFKRIQFSTWEGISNAITD